MTANGTGRQIIGPKVNGLEVDGPRDNSVIDFRRRSLWLSSSFPKSEPVMLDQAFMSDRPYRDHQPTISRPDLPATASLQPLAASGSLAAISTIKGLFLRQVAERFMPPRAIFWEGDAAEDVFYVLEGCLRVYRIVQDGRRAILGFLYAGDLLGVSFRSIYPFTAEVVTPVRLRRLARHRFHELVDDSRDLRSQLLAEISNEMTVAQDQIIRLGRTAADERVATFLLQIACQTGADAVTPVEIDVPFGRLDIADYLGLTVETVSRELSKLKRDGLISMRSPHRIVLRRLHSLRDIAGMDVDKHREDGPPEATRTLCPGFVDIKNPGTRAA
jgi:CRP/FNR family transcriptional regulator, anaerobic regulatory protein